MSEEYKKKIVDPKMIQRFHKYYKGDFYEGSVDTNRIAVNTVFPNVKVLQAALALNSPTFKVIADDPALKSREPIVEALLDNSFYKMNYTRTLKKCVRDAHLNWGGVACSGYNFKLSRKALGGEDVRNLENSKDIKDFTEFQIYHEYVKEDSIYCMRKSPNLFFLDPDATENLVDAKFDYDTIIVPSQFIEDKYGIEKTSIPTKVAEWLFDIVKSLGLGNDKDVAKAVIRQIYSLEEGKRIVLIEGTDKAFEYDWDYDFYPHSLLIFTENPDENYGTPDIKIYESQQLELNKIRTVMMNTVNRNNPRWQMLTNSMNPEEVKKFEANITSSIISVSQDGAIKPIQQLPLDQNLQVYEPRCANDIREGQGIDEIMRGGQAAIRKSATETATRDFYSRLRINERKETVDEFSKDVAVKSLAFMQKEYTIPRFIKIVGADAKFLTLNTQNENMKEMLKNQTTYSGQFPVVGGEASAEKQEGNIVGKYQLYIRTSSYASNKMQDAQILQTFLPFLAINPMISPKELTELVVSVGLDGFDTSKLVVPDAYDIATDPVKAEKFRQIMMGMGKGMGQSGQGGEVRPSVGAGSASPGMTEAKMGSEAQQPAPQRNTMTQGG